MSTEFRTTESGPSEKISPTSTWAPLNKTVQPQSFVAPFYVSGALYLFAQNQQNTLSIGKVGFSGTTASWSDYNGYACNASPAVAMARADQGYLGVACLQSATIVDIYYVQPSANKVSQVSVTGKLDRGTVLTGVQLAQNFDGRIEVFASDTNGNIWHAYETNHGVPATWSVWSKLGTASRTEKEFLAIQIPGGSNAGCIQVVVLGSDGRMYQATEVLGRVGQYNPFTVVGKYDDLRNSATFVWGPAAAYDPSDEYMVYGAYNTAPKDGNSSLDYCYGATAQWQAVSGTTANASAAQPPVVLNLTTDGVTHYLWGDNEGQFWMLNRKGNVWSTSPQQVGRALPALTGYLTAVANDNKVGLIQTRSDGEVMFINVVPN